MEVEEEVGEETREEGCLRSVESIYKEWLLEKGHDETSLIKL